MPAFPHFDDDALTELTAAFQSRSKAITHHAPKWTIARDVDDKSERLNVDANAHHGQLRLSVWADRAVWFRLCRGRAKNGWDLMLSFHGDANSVNAATLVEQFIASLSCGDHLSIWQNVAPVVQRSEPIA